MRELFPQEFRPSTAPRDVAGFAGTNPRRPAPVRRMDPLAPTAPSMPTAPRPSDNMTQLVRGLEALNPQLSALFSEYFAEDRKGQIAEASSQADAMALQGADVWTYADAVRKDPSLADKSPFYRTIYEQRLAKAAGLRLGSTLQAEYWKDGISGSEDPAAIGEWLKERVKGYTERYKDAPAPARMQAAETLQALVGEMTGLHVRNAGKNLVQKNEDSVSAETNAVFDAAHQKGTPLDQLAAQLREVEVKARAQGLDGRMVNNIMASATAEAMVRHGRADYRQIGMISRQDGTPGWGATSEARRILSHAEDRIQSRAVQQANLAWTQEQRMRARVTDAAITKVIDFGLEQHKAGQPLKLPQEYISALAKHDPDAALKAMSTFDALSKWSDNTDPRMFGFLQLQAQRGALSDKDLMDGLEGKIINNEQFSKLRDLSASAKSNPMLNNPVISSLIERAATIVGDPDKMGGPFRQPQAALAVEGDLRQRVIDWAKKNPEGGIGELQSEVIKWRDELVPLYTNNPMDAFRPDAKRAEAEKPPVYERKPKDASSHPAYNHNHPIAQDMKTVAFPKVAEFEDWMKKLEQNPRDLSNPIVQWMAAKKINDLNAWVAAQRKMYNKQTGWFN